MALSASGFREARRFGPFGELVDRYRDARAIGVDIPFGLAEGKQRDADAAARDYLTGQASSVFSAPPREVLAAADYDEAQSISRRLVGKGMSEQAFAIVPKIREVDAFACDDRIHEVHSEICFKVLNDGAALRARKKTWGGIQHRLSLLKTAGIHIPSDLGDANAVGTDDVVDAAVAAWSARRIAEGAARRFPAEPTQRDRSGRSIVIWA